MSETPGAAVLIERSGAVGIATLNRPEKFNCVSSELLAGLRHALSEFEDDDAVRVMLVRANGKQFCTGADLLEVTEARKTHRTMQAYISNFHDALNALEDSPLPIVCAVHGLALAGGLEIMMACDVAFAADSAKLGDQHAQYGLIPGGGGSQRLPRLIGLRRALDFMYSARWVEAEEAAAWGLVNYVVPGADLDEQSQAYCQTLASRSPQGITAMKQMSRKGLGMSPADGLRYEEAVVPDALREANVTEGLTAFVERRPPNFS